MGDIGGIASGLASAFGAYMSYKGQTEANEQNTRLFHENQAWQERMSSTAWQRAVGDMQAAGLNPMLAYSKGGASTPGVSQPDMKSTTAESARHVADAVSRAVQVDNVKADSAVKEAQAVNIAADTKLKLEGTLPEQISSAGRQSAVEAQVRQEMGTFEQRMHNLRSEGHLMDTRAALAAAQRATSMEERLKILREHTEKMPAEIKHLYAQAGKLVAEAKLLGLKVPEAVAEAAFFSGPDAKSAMYFRHAPKTLTSAWAGALGAAADDVRGFELRMPRREVERGPTVSGRIRY